MLSAAEYTKALLIISLEQLKLWYNALITAAAKSLQINATGLTYYWSVDK